jgi:hypothetical protein
MHSNDIFSNVQNFVTKTTIVNVSYLFGFCVPFETEHFYVLVAEYDPMKTFGEPLRNINFNLVPILPKNSLTMRVNNIDREIKHIFRLHNVCEHFQLRQI